MENKYNGNELKKIIQNKAKHREVSVDKYLKSINIAPRTYYDTLLGRTSINTLLHILNKANICIDNITTSSNRVSHEAYMERDSYYRNAKNLLNENKLIITNLTEELEKKKEEIQYLLQRKRIVDDNLKIKVLTSKVIT
jgi:aspartokinase